VSIADETRRILILEAFAAEAKAAAAEGRARLSAQAREQLATEGVAPSWNLPQIAKVTLGVTSDALEIDDADKFRAWVEIIAPEQIEHLPRVRPGYTDLVLKTVKVDGEFVVWPDTGETVPGLKVRIGGQPKNLSIVPQPGVRAYVNERAAELLGTANKAIAGQPAVDAEVPDPFALFPPTGGAS